MTRAWSRRKLPDPPPAKDVDAAILKLNEQIDQAERNSGTPEWMMPIIRAKRAMPKAAVFSPDMTAEPGGDVEKFLLGLMDAGAVVEFKSESPWDGIVCFVHCGEKLLMVHVAQVKGQGDK